VTDIEARDECSAVDAQKAVSITSRQVATPGTVMIRPLLLKPQWMNGLSRRD